MCFQEVSVLPAGPSGPGILHHDGSSGRPGTPLSQCTLKGVFSVT